MASPQTIDFEALLAPIPGPSPAGESLRYAGTYDAIQDARRSDDALAQGEWRRDTKVANWGTVVKLATEALSTKSKDIQIGAWLVEALVKQHGFAGLRDGLRLLRELHERFWDTLHPALEDGDLETRSAPLEWLNDKLPTSMKAVAVTRSRGGDRYSWLQWEESRAVENLGRQSAEARDEALAEGKISGDQFDKAVAGTPRVFYESLLQDMDGAWEEWQGLDRAADEKFGRQAPSLLDVRKSLEDCRTLVEGITKRKRELEPDPAPAAAGQASDGGATEDLGYAPTPGSVPLEPRDRADALRRLAAVASFFRRTEPHSPVSYLVQRAVQWGQMPLEQWLRDVIADESVLARVRETLGLKESGASTE
jgi:type VI secretion system protein ImpA